MEILANQVMAVLDHVEAGPLVVLGHSMGGAVAVQFAHDHPRHTLGLIYRDGVSTPAWKARHGVVSSVLAPFAPNIAPMVDLATAAVSDMPDLLIGRMFSTFRSVLPEVRRNVRTVGQTLPIGSLLMSIDQRSEVRALVAQQIPILNEWGCFDRITPTAVAVEFADVARAPGAVGARRAQLDAGAPAGPVRHTPAPGYRQGVHGQCREALAPVHCTRPHVARRQLGVPAREELQAHGTAGAGRPVIAHLLDPLLNLHGWEAYALVGALVFAEASILIGFVFPGETAVILGGVAASRHNINIVVLIVLVVTCAIAGDSVGYLVGEKWGRRLLQTRFLRNRQRVLNAVFDQLNRRGADRGLRLPLHRVPTGRRPGTGRHLRHALPGLPPGQRGRVASCGEPPTACWATSWATPTPGWSMPRASRPTSSSASSPSSSSY